MRDDLDQALDKNPDYPPGFNPRDLEDPVDEEEVDSDEWEESAAGVHRQPQAQSKTASQRLQNSLSN